MRLTKYTKLGITRYRARLLFSFFIPYILGGILSFTYFRSISIVCLIVGGTGIFISSIIITKYDMQVADEKMKTRFDP